MSRLVSRNNVLRLVLVLFCGVFYHGHLRDFLLSLRRPGARRPCGRRAASCTYRLMTAAVVSCSRRPSVRPNIALLSQCTTTVEVVNAGGTPSAEFEYSIDVWADTNWRRQRRHGLPHDDDLQCPLRRNAGRGGMPTLSATSPDVGCSSANRRSRASPRKRTRSPSRATTAARAPSSHRCRVGVACPRFFHPSAVLDARAFAQMS